MQLKQQVLDEMAARLKAARSRPGAAAVPGDPPLSGAAWYQQQATRYDMFSSIVSETFLFLLFDFENYKQSKLQ